MKKNFILNGVAAYNNGPDELNRICKELYGEEVRSIKLEDINNCLQYEPQSGIYFSKYDEEKNEFELQVLPKNIKTLADLKEKGQPEIINGETLWDSIIGTGKFVTPDGKENQTTLSNYPLDARVYNAFDGYLKEGLDTTKGGKLISKEKSFAIFGFDGKGNYALATRGIHLAKGVAVFGLGKVKSGAVISGADGWANASGENVFGMLTPCNLRPLAELTYEMPKKVEKIEKVSVCFPSYPSSEIVCPNWYINTL